MNSLLLGENNENKKFETSLVGSTGFEPVTSSASRKRSEPS